MHGFGKRAWMLIGLGLLAVPVVAVAVSYACTGLATLSVSPGAVKSGSVLTVAGKGFAAHDPSDARTGPAEIRVDSLSNPVIATVTTASDGTFSVPVKVPQLAAGDHVIIATQNTAAGAPAYGTPARQVFSVIGSLTSGGGSAATGGGVATTVDQIVAPALTMASARRLARLHVKKASPRAKRIRASCSRRTRTSAVCRVRYRVGKRVLRSRLIVRSASTSAAW